MPSAGSSQPDIGFVTEPARQTPVREDVDVLVVGGGAAGLAAAVSAVRNGARVLLVERYGFLGGTLTNVTLGSICGMYTIDGDEIMQVAGGFVAELVERLKKAGGANGPLRWLETASMPYDAPTLRLVADEIVDECGIRVSFHAAAVGVMKDGSRVSGVIFEDRAGRWAARARTVIDCTGNGDIAAHAGAAFEYDPALLQAPTTMFRFAGVDTERASGITRAELHDRLERAVEAGLQLPRTAGGMFSPRPGVMHLNITRVSRDGAPPDLLDSDDLAWAEMEGRRQLALYEQAFRRFVPGFEDCYIADIGAEIGIRESRRVRGDYWLELNDVLNEARFDDAIACSAWPVEEHSAGRATRWVFLKPGTYYQLPFRIMLPRGIEGLLVAGRCASASHDAHASMRVAATCMAMGEAAGVAAAFASRERLALRDIDVAAVQARLLEQGAFLGNHISERIL